MRRSPLALGLLAFVVVTGCDDPDSVPVQPSRTASVLTLSAFPTTVLRSGSDVRVTARATDGQGALVEGTPVTFTASSGALSTPAASTSSSGTASVTLSASDVARVTASLSSGASAAIDLPAVSPFTLALERPSTVLVGGTTFGALITPNTAVVNPPAPTAVTINCGFGSAVDVTATRTHRCEFPSAGDFVVEAAARTANGWTIAERVQITAVTSATPPSSPSPTTGSLTLSASQVSGREWRITATSTVPVREFVFRFGDGVGKDEPTARRRFDGPGGLTASEQHIYGAADSYTVTVSTEAVDRRLDDTEEIVIQVP
jgi:Big-like domain-containing protein